MTTYEDLVAATLPHGLVPLCVPQLRTITLGGAVTGLGIESASWRNGCPHESVLDLDVLTGDGRVVTATADQRARRPVPRLPELLRLAGLRAAPAHRARAGHAVRARCATCRAATPRGWPRRSARSRRPAMHDGDARRLRRRHGVLRARSPYLTAGDVRRDGAAACRATTPASRSTTARSRSAATTCSPTHDYLWRWDTDWFWCSRAFGAQNPRRAPAVAEGPAALATSTGSSSRSTGVRRSPPALGAARRRPPREQVVQDIEVPRRRAAGLPRLLPPRGRASRRCGSARCGSATPTPRWPLYPLDPAVTYVNVGLLVDGRRAARRRPGGGAGQPPHRGRRDATSAATSRCTRRRYYDRDEFARLYGGDDLRAAPGGRTTRRAGSPDMWTKTVGRA